MVSPPTSRPWKHYHELRPAELEMMLMSAPVAFWPLGMLEHHGWHLPIGFDGLKVEAICARIATETGGVLLPTMWWASGGGHDEFPWTHYQPPQAVAEILVTTTRQLIAFGFKVIVLMAGHYPWQPLLDQHLPALASEAPDVLLMWGSEMTIGPPQITMGGDHAAREETSSGLYLFPERVNMAALTDDPNRCCKWPAGQERLPHEREPSVCYDPASPSFAQAGVDAREASAEQGRQNLEPLISYIVQVVKAKLADGAPGA